MKHNLSKLNISNKDKIVMTKNNEIILKNVPIKEQREFDLKPNGLWYGCGTEWIEWVRGEMPHWEHKHLFKLDINFKSILIVDSEEKLIKFHNKYYFTENHIIGSINWVEMKKEYKGIEINPYQYEFRFKPHFLWYYGWDVASGCIWDMSAIKKIIKLK